MSNRPANFFLHSTKTVMKHSVCIDIMVWGRRTSFFWSHQWLRVWGSEEGKLKDFHLSTTTIPSIIYRWSISASGWRLKRGKGKRGWELVEGKIQWCDLKKCGDLRKWIQLQGGREVNTLYKCRIVEETAYEECQLYNSVFINGLEQSKFCTCQVILKEIKCSELL